MKKIILASVAVLMSVSLSAQIYVGGSLDLASASTEDKLASTTSKASAFTLSPRVGYYLSEKLSVGATLYFASGKLATDTKILGLGLTPYARYNVLQLGNFNLLAEAGLGFNTNTRTTTTSGVGNQKNTDNVFRIYARPVISCDLTDKITVEANLNFANLAYTSTTSKGVWHQDSPSGDTTTADDSKSTFGLGVDTSDVFGVGIGNITIGFTYKF